MPQRLKKFLPIGPIHPRQPRNQMRILTCQPSQHRPCLRNTGSTSHSVDNLTPSTKFFEIDVHNEDPMFHAVEKYQECGGSQQFSIDTVLILTQYLSSFSCAIISEEKYLPIFLFSGIFGIEYDKHSLLKMSTFLTASIS